MKTQSDSTGEGMNKPNHLRLVPPLHFCWFSTPAGNCPAEDDLDDVKQIHAQARMRATIKRHVEGKSRPRAVTHLGNQIYEFRVQDSGIWLRVLFFTSNPHIVGVKTVVKKQNKADGNDLDYATRCKGSWVPENCQGATDLSWW